MNLRKEATTHYRIHTTRSNGSGSFDHLYVECQSDREHGTVVPCIAFERVAFVHIFEWNPFV